MGHGTRNWRSLQVSCLRRQFAQGSGLPFSEVLSAEMVQQVLEEVGGFFRERVFTPLTTVWVFLSQVTSADGSCRNAGVGGFPRAGLFSLFPLPTGGVPDVAWGPCRGKGKGELSLFRKLRSRLQAGDVLLGDRHFCAQLYIAAGLRLGVDFVGRLHQARR